MSSSCSLSTLSTLFVTSTNCLGPYPRICRCSVTADTLYLGTGDPCMGFVWAFLRESSLYHGKVGAHRSRAAEPSNLRQMVIQRSRRRKCTPTANQHPLCPQSFLPTPALSLTPLRPFPGAVFRLCAAEHPRYSTARETRRSILQAGRCRVFAGVAGQAQLSSCLQLVLDQTPTPFLLPNPPFLTLNHSSGHNQRSDTPMPVLPWRWG